MIIAVIIVCAAYPAYAADILETVGGLNNLIYGIAAGLAALMITLHAIRWKTADNPNDREEAKRGIINVILALLLIMVAGAVISVIYVKPPETEPPTTSRVPTTRAPPPTTTTTTTLATTSTTTTPTTTTTTLSTTLLNAKNLANCIKAAGGKLYSDPSWCPHCLAEKVLWDNEIDTGTGTAALASIPQSTSTSCACGGIPCWDKTVSSPGYLTGCATFIDLNQAYNCKLTKVAGHTYLAC